MAVVIAAVIVATAGFFTPQQTVHEDVTLLRVTIVDNLVRSFIQYSEQSLRITTRAALDNLTEILALHDDDNMTLYFANMSELTTNIDRCLLNQSFSQLSLQGYSINNVGCIEDFTLIDRLDIFVNLVEETYNVQIDYSLELGSFFINQTNPFEARTNINFSSIIISDLATNANWSMQNHTISIRLPLLGLQDPVTTKFARSIYTTNDFEPYFFNQATRPNSNISQMLDIMESQEFVRTPAAPSILGRYVGNFSPISIFGLEAFINGSQINHTAAASLWPGNITKPQIEYSFIDWHVLISDHEQEHIFAPKTFDCSELSFLNSTDLGINTSDYFWVSTVHLFNRYNVSSQERTSC